MNHCRPLLYAIALGVVHSFCVSSFASPKGAVNEVCKQSVTVEEFRAIALERSVLVAEIDSQYARQLSEAYSIEVLRNPEVQIEHVHTRAGLGGADDPQTNASVSMPLRLSDFGAKSRVARLLRQAGDLQKRAQLLEFSQKILLQYSNLYLLQRLAEVLVEAEQRAAKKVKLVHEGVKKGLLTEGDHQLFEAEKYRLQSQRAGVRASLSALQAELAMELGSGCEVRAATPLFVGPLPAVDELVRRAHESAISEASRAEIFVKLGAEQKRLAQIDAFPEIAPRIVYQHTNDGGDFVGAGLTIPLPFFNRNRGAIAQTSAELAAIERRQNLLVASGMDVQIRSLRIAAESTAEQARIYERNVLPSLESALRSQERLYVQGKGNVLLVWQTLRTYNDAQQEALNVSLAAVNARVKLSILVGDEV